MATNNNVEGNYSLSNPNQSIASLLSQLVGYSSLPNTYIRPDYVDVINPGLRGVQSLQDALGLTFTYDRDAIEKIYQDATRAAYEVEANSGAERRYYKNIADAQNTALDTVRQQYGQAVATGANRGMQAANLLSTILGNTQIANGEATQLATDRQTLMNNYAAQLKQDSVDALKYSNEQANAIAGLSRQLYNDDIQGMTSQLAYNQGINTDYAGYAANQYSANANLLGTNNATAAGMYNNNQSSIAAILTAIEQARATKYAAEQARDSNINYNYSGDYTVYNGQAAPKK